MSSGDSQGLDELRRENELLNLQIKQLQEELDLAFAEHCELLRAKPQADPSNLPDSTRFGDFTGPDVRHAGRLALVRHLLKKSGSQSSLSMTLEEIVRSDPDYLSQVSRADRAERELTVLKETLASDQKSTQSRLEELSRQFEATRKAQQDGLSQIGKELSQLEPVSTLTPQEFRSTLEEFGDALNGTMTSKLEGLLGALSASLQVYFAEIEDSLTEFQTKTINDLGDRFSALLESHAMPVSLAELDDRFHKLGSTISESSKSLSLEALAPLSEAQQQAEALRNDLSTALKLQAIRDSDLKELQQRFSLLGEAKSEQEAILLALRDKLGMASAYLRNLRQGHLLDEREGSAQDLASLLSQDS